LIGVDLQKDVPTIEAAYNDSRGVTAQFNLNLLRRINRELGADFDLDAFSHTARYNASAGRMEIFLVSEADQVVQLDGEEFEFAVGEPICTEYSYKFTIRGFSQIAADAGLTLRRAWTDEHEYFAVLHFVIES
jgi:uncharacterized SAM-dependent methyltransferase